MPLKGLTWARFKEHLRKSAAIYIVGIIVCVVLSNILYTSTRPQVPAEREVLIYLVNGYSNPDPLNDLCAQALTAMQAEDETLEEVHVESLMYTDPSQDYTSSYVLMTRMSVGDGGVMLDQAAAAGAIVIGRDHQQRVRAQSLRLHGLANGRARVVRARSDDERNPPRAAAERAFHDGRTLVRGDGGRFAGGAENHERVRVRVDLPVDQVLQRVVVHAPAAKGRDHRDAAAVKELALHA